MLYYLCQTRLDQESPEFMQEILSAQAKLKDKKVDKSKAKKKTDEKKEETKIVDPLQFKPLGKISQGNLKGIYYHMPHFHDSRIYKHNPIEVLSDNGHKSRFGDYELIAGNHTEVSVLMAKLQEDGSEDSLKIFEQLKENLPEFRKFDEALQLKENNR